MRLVWMPLSVVGVQFTAVSLGVRDRWIELRPIKRRGGAHGVDGLDHWEEMSESGLFRQWTDSRCSSVP